MRRRAPGVLHAMAGRSSVLVSGTTGLTLIELLFAIAVGTTVTAIAVPLTGEVLDEVRTASAARYISGRIMTIRMDAIRYSTACALRFEPDDEDYVFAAFADGNGNGVRTAEIRSGVDRQIASSERIRDKFPGVKFALLSGVPDADGAPVTSLDGVRIGTARILTMSPDGTATSGTLYISGRHSQYAVRVLGITGRTRVLRYSAGSRSWTTR